MTYPVMLHTVVLPVLRALACGLMAVASFRIGHVLMGAAQERAK